MPRPSPPSTAFPRSGAPTASGTSGWRPSRRRHRRRSPLLGLSLRRRRRRPQRPAHNYHQWRRRLERLGHRLVRMRLGDHRRLHRKELHNGDPLETTIKESLDDFDGVFTYVVVTKDALGMAKDVMAAKPLVLFESDDLVALASEEVAIRALIDHEIDTTIPTRARCSYGLGSRRRALDQVRRPGLSSRTPSRRGRRRSRGEGRLRCHRPHDAHDEPRDQVAAHREGREGHNH